MTNVIKFNQLRFKTNFHRKKSRIRIENVLVHDIHISTNRNRKPVNFLLPCSSVRSASFFLVTTDERIGNFETKPKKKTLTIK